MTPPPSFRIGLTDDGVCDMVTATASARQLMDQTPAVEWASFPTATDPIDPATLDQFDVVLTGGSHLTAASVAGVERCTGLIRFGAGYDRIDLDACTRAGLILATTPEGIRRAMSTAAMTHILALATGFATKRRLLHQGRWDEAMGTTNEGVSLTGKTIGYVGFGNIGRDLYHLIHPFQMHHLVCDPYLDQALMADYDIQRVDLDALLQRADFVVVLCTLTEETHHLIGAAQLQRMKASAFLVNVARGAIIDQQALAGALAAGEIRGAGLDALDPEPIAPDDPLLHLDSANLTPHALGYSDEMIRLCSELCVQGSLDIMAGRAPASVINRTVLEAPRLQVKLAAYRRQFGA